MGSPEITIRTPIKIEKLKDQQIMQIYSGQTFTLFVNEKWDVFGCGLNDCCQLSMETQKNGSNTWMNDVVIPKKIDSLTNAIILNVDCGTNHS